MWGFSAGADGPRAGKWRLIILDAVSYPILLSWVGRLAGNHQVKA